MKKYVMSLVLSCVVLATLAAQKKDTVVLSVYNNNQRFMLYPMPFGKNKPDKNFVPARQGTSPLVKGLPSAKNARLASIFNAMRTIYCVSDARELLYNFSQVL